MFDKHLDVTGKEITVGCTVVTPGRRGSSVWLTVAEVVRIDPAKGLVLKEGNKRPYYRKGMGGAAIIKDAINHE